MNSCLLQSTLSPQVKGLTFVGGGKGPFILVLEGLIFASKTPSQEFPQGLGGLCRFSSPPLPHPSPVPEYLGRLAEPAGRTLTQGHTANEEHLHNSNSIHVLLLNKPPSSANKSSAQREAACVLSSLTQHNSCQATGGLCSTQISYF